jgi:hypothetical protein
MQRDGGRELQALDIPENARSSVPGRGNVSDPTAAQPPQTPSQEPEYGQYGRYLLQSFHD